MGDWRDQAKEFVKNKMQKSTYKLAEGDNTIRILPNTKGLDHPPYEMYMVHREIGPNKKFLRCGKSANDGSGECWLCDTLIPKLEASNKKSQRALAKAMAPKEQCVVQIAYLDRDSDKLRGPKFWLVSTGGAKSLSVALLTILSRTQKRYDDPKRGYNLTINRVGTGFKDTKYGNFDPDDEPTQVPKEILSKLKPFSEFSREYDPDEQKKAYRGDDDDDDTADVDDDDVVSDEADVIDAEEEAKKKKKPALDDDDDDAGDDDDDEPKPSKKKKPAEDDDEDEPAPPKKGKKKPVDDDDDDAEAPTPSKKKKVVADDDDEPPAPKKGKAKPPVDDDDDEPKPSKKKKVVADDDEDEPPAKPAKKKKPVEDDDEDDLPPKKGKKPALDEDDDDDDDDAPPQKRNRRHRDDEEEEEEDDDE